MAKALSSRERVKQYQQYFGLFCKDCLKIKTEDEGIKPFILNETQEKIAEYLIGCWFHNKPIRLIVLKARREGVSTLIGAFIFWRTAMMNNTNAYVVSHNDVGVSYLFDMQRLFYDSMPDDMRPMKRHDNSKMLKFENPNDEERLKRPGRRSEIRLGSANDKNLGSGYLTHIIHFSELGKCNNAEELMINIKPSVPASGGVIIESTAYGAGNYFHREWIRACNHESDYTAMFFPWYAHKEYVAAVAPGFALTEKESRMKEQYNLTNEQIQWRRNAIRSICDGDEEYFKQEYPSNDREAFLVSGRSVFAPTVLDWYENHALGEPIWTGEVDILVDKEGREKAYMSKREDGRLKIWKLPDKNQETEYCLGSDVSEGIDIKIEGRRSKGDRSAFHVIEQHTGRLCAKFVGWIEPDTLGKMIYAVGKYYNWAYLGIEANNYGILVLTTIRDMGYSISRIHHTLRYGTDFDDRTERMGWWTSRKTKPLLISTLATSMREREIGYINEKGRFLGIDIDTISELRTFTRGDTGKMSATSGCYDDQVISLAIAWMMVMISRGNVPAIQSKPNKELDDFNKRAIMLNA